VATDNKLFLQVRGLGRVLNPRNYQGQDPAPAPGSVLVPYNSPRTGASKPGVTAIGGDYMPWRYGCINYAGTMGAMTAGIPFVLLPNTSMTEVQSAFSAGDNSGVGAGINTDFTETEPRTRYYALAVVATETNLARGINPLIQPNGRPMAYGWDAVTAFESFTFTQQTALQKVSITVPDLRGLTPSVPGITDSVAAGTVGGWAAAVFCFLSNPVDVDDRRAMPGYFIAQGALSGFTAIDAFDPSELANRGLYYPSTFQNFSAARAICNYKNIFVAVGGGESLQGPTYGSVNLSDGTGTAAPGDQPYMVSVGGPSKVLGLRLGTSGNKPHDPRTCQIVSATVNGDGSGVTFVVENYHYFTTGQSVYIANLDPVITGCPNGAYTVTVPGGTPGITTFTISAAPGTFSGGPSTSGVCMLNVMTTQEWWIGKVLNLGTYGQVTIVRLVDETGTATGIEIDKTLNIGTPVPFQISGKAWYQVGISDERGYCLAPSGLSGEIGEDIGGPPNGVAAGSNGTYIYGPSGGCGLVNIPLGTTLKGNHGSTPDTKPYIDPYLKLSYGCSGPNALTFGPGGDLLGFAIEIGPWRQSGVTQQLLDPQQKWKAFYRRVRFGQSGESDETGNVQIAYCQNLNIALIVFEDIDQFLCIDFRNQQPIISPWVIFGQRITGLAKVQLYRPVAIDALGTPTTPDYMQDTEANVGDVIQIALQSGDILELNENFFSDYCTRFEVDEDGGANFRGIVTAAFADHITTDVQLSEFYQAGNSPTNASAICMIVDGPQLSYAARAIEDITLSGADQYAIIDVAVDNHGIAPGSWITVSGVVGIGGINGSTRWPVDSVPFSDTIVIDGGAPGAFTGAYVSGGRVEFPTLGDLVGSYVGMNDQFNFGSNVWTQGPPFPGMTVCVNPIYCICETPDLRKGPTTTIDWIDRVDMDNDAYDQGELWFVRLRILASGQQWTPTEARAAVTDYPGTATATGAMLPVAASISGNSVRLRLEWLNMAGGNTQLNCLALRWSGQTTEGEISGVLTLNTFPQSDRRADRADVEVLDDLNVVRGASEGNGPTSIKARPGTRLLTVQVETRPVEMVNPTQSPIADYQASRVYANFVLCGRCGGDYFIAYSENSNLVEEGFPYGTRFMIGVNGAGALADPIPYNGY